MHQGIFIRRYMHWLLLLVLPLLGCEREEYALSDSDPLIGFGDTTAVLSLGGDDLVVPILLTKTLSQDRSLPVKVSGDPDLLALIDTSALTPITLMAGSLESYFSLSLPAATPESLAGSFLILSLEAGAGYRVSDRDSLYVYVGFQNTVRTEIWAPRTSFPQLWGYSSHSEEPVPEGNPNRHFMFAYPSTKLANVISLGNSIEGKGSNVLNMVRLYAEEGVRSGSANINVPDFLLFTPSFAGSTSGRVDILTQRVTITRTASSGLPPFTIGLSGQGTYDEATGVIALTVIFDESEIGGGSAVVRNYSLEAEERD
jgi:hypothetical protein